MRKFLTRIYESVLKILGKLAKGVLQSLTKQTVTVFEINNED